MASSDRRTLELTERLPQVARLTRADVSYLLDKHRAHVAVEPTGRRGRYRLTARGHVGVLFTPTCRLVLRPKIPLANLFHLLDPAASPEAVDDWAEAEPGAEALTFLAGCLARRLRERVAAGLHRGYVERAEASRFLHGRLDVAAQLRERPTRRDVVHSRFEEFTVDVPCNQMPRATAEALVNHPWLREGLRAALRQSLAGFAEVAPVPTAEVALDRLTEDYRPLLDLCGLVRDGLAGGRNEGAVTCPAFLLDMERVFERYVTAGFVAALGGGPVHVAVQPTFAASVAVAGQPDLCMRPDLVVLREGRPVLVADVKWKRVAGTPLVTADLYQVLAYATALGVQRAVLIYPGGRGRAWRYRMARSPVEVEIRAVRVVGAPEACNRSLLRAGIGLHRLLSGLLKDS